MREILQRGGYRVVVHSSAQGGLDRTRAEQPDLILLDQFSPQMDGLELLAALGRDPQTRHIPIVILASRHQSATKIRALWRGAREYLVKPVDPVELLEVVALLSGDQIREAAAV